MIRLADTRLVSAVLISADKTDESLGVIATPEAGQDAQAEKENPYPDPDVSSPQPVAAHRSERSYDQ